MMMVAAHNQSVTIESNDRNHRTIGGVFEKKNKKKKPPKGLWFIVRPSGQLRTARTGFRSRCKRFRLRGTHLPRRGNLR